MKYTDHATDRFTASAAHKGPRLRRTRERRWVHSRDRGSHLLLLPRHFSSPKGSPGVLLPLPILLSSLPWWPQRSVPEESPIPDVPYKWNHSIWDLSSKRGLGATASGTQSPSKAPRSPGTQTVLQPLPAGALADGSFQPGNRVTAWALPPALIHSTFVSTSVHLLGAADDGAKRTRAATAFPEPARPGRAAAGAVCGGPGARGTRFQAALPLRAVRGQAQAAPASAPHWTSDSILTRVRPQRCRQSRRADTCGLPVGWAARSPPSPSPAATRQGGGVGSSPPFGAAGSERLGSWPKATEPVCGRRELEPSPKQ